MPGTMETLIERHASSRNFDGSLDLLGLQCSASNVGILILIYQGFVILLCVCAESLQLCPTLCGPKNHSPPGSSRHRIFWARTLEWVATSSSRGLPDPGTKPAPLMSPAPAGRFFTTSATWEACHPSPGLSANSH